MNNGHFRIIHSLRIFLVLAGMFGLGVFAVLADTNYVVPPGTPDVAPAPAYLSWATAATSIIDAVTASSNGNVVLLTNNSTYYLTNVVTITKSITVQSSDNNRNNTIVNGNSPVYTNRCFYLDSTGVVVDGVTITNSCTNGSGGGVYINNGILRNSIISSNTGLNGGGFYIGGSGGLVSNCVIRGNYSANEGGGFNISAGTIANCTISDNTAASQAGGGNLYGTARGCIISNNNSGGQGGGVTVKGGAVLRDSLIINNTVRPSSDTWGGGVYLESGGLASNCIIQGNTAQYGGGINLDGLLVDCIIVGNISTTSSQEKRGGVRFKSNSKTRNCLIVSNTGGGMSCYSAATNTSIDNCTITANTGTYAGVYWANNVTTMVANTIIYQNTGNSSSNWFTNTSGTAVYFTNCCTAPLTGLTGTGNIDSNPAFADTNAGNYRLANNSPCINTGINQDWMTNAVDLDGRMRIRYGIVDMGAYEKISEGTIYGFR